MVAFRGTLPAAHWQAVGPEQAAAAGLGRLSLLPGRVGRGCGRRAVHPRQLCLFAARCKTPGAGAVGGLHWLPRLRYSPQVTRGLMRLR